MTRKFTPPTGAWCRFAWVIALGIAFSVPALAAPAATPAEPAPTAKLGRENPYRPLVQKRSTVMTFEAPDGMPPPPALPQAPAARPLMEALEFVGVAYDNGEAIAAVSVDGKTMLVKKGEQLDGATVLQITPHKLVWRKANRTIVKHIRRGVRS